jgi:hypothetical protein
MATDREGSLWDKCGVLRHFSPQALTKLSADLDRCFICGVHKQVCAFNDEHVIPNWILRHYRLHGAQITYPNGRKGFYSRYKLRCCVQCNSLLGRHVEWSTAKLLRTFTFTPPFPRFVDVGLYRWLCLLFIKTHLKDWEISGSPDLRENAPLIAAGYDWTGLHHIHAVARSAQSRCHIDWNVVGTILLFKMRGKSDDFDFGTLSDYSTIYLRTGTIGIIAVLNDSGLVSGMLGDFLSRVTGALSPLQFREIAARVAYGNALIRDRPTYHSLLTNETDLTMHATLPENLELYKPSDQALGALMAHVCGQMLDPLAPNVASLLRKIRGGGHTLVFDANNQFVFG